MTGGYTKPQGCDIVSPEQDDLKEFLLVLRRALLMVTGWIEKRYRIEAK